MYNRNRNRRCWSVGLDQLVPRWSPPPLSKADAAGVAARKKKTWRPSIRMMQAGSLRRRKNIPITLATHA